MRTLLHASDVQFPKERQTAVSVAAVCQETSKGKVKRKSFACMDATGGQYLPYQNEPIVPSSEDSGEELAIDLDMRMKKESNHPSYEIVVEELPPLSQWQVK